MVEIPFIPFTENIFHVVLLFSGTFVPVTMGGNIVVDGDLASCYASSDHHAAHIGMTPIRWFPEIMNWIFGIDNGSPGYVKFARSLGRWVLPVAVTFLK